MRFFNLHQANGKQAARARFMHAWPAHVAVTGLATMVAACGFLSPEFHKYDAPPDAEGFDETEACTMALSTYRTTVMPAFDRACANCHPSLARISRMEMKKGDAASQRAALLAYSNGDADQLYNKYNSDDHGGKAQGYALPKDAITAWLAKEVGCN